MKDLKGKTVRMKPSIAKWYLNHLGIYTNGLKWDKEFKSETIIHALCAAGYSIEGKVLRAGNTGCYLVKWNFGPFTAKYYIDRKDFEVL